MKTPDEIKKADKCCNHGSCGECPYYPSTTCLTELNDDRTEYIRQLEMLAKPNNQIRWERDIAIDQLNKLGIAFGEKVCGSFLKFMDVNKGLPINERPVLIVTRWSHGDKEGLSASMAFHTDGNTYTGNSNYDWDSGDVDLIYDEENDEYIVPEGWWESVRYSEQFSAVDEPVLYWADIGIRRT